MTNDKTRLLRLATYASVTTAGILILAKLVAWLMTGSVTVLASLVDSLMDAGASIVNLIAVRYALLPPDEEHRFGHGKAEALAGLAQAAFIIGSSVFLGAQRRRPAAPPPAPDRDRRGLGGDALRHPRHRGPADLPVPSHRPHPIHRRTRRRPALRHRPGDQCRHRGRPGAGPLWLVRARSLVRPGHRRLHPLQRPAHRPGRHRPAHGPGARHPRSGHVSANWPCRSPGSATCMPFAPASRARPS